jgi:outer membrane protein OmpA-like peptidoglycan-associated protein
MIALILTVGVAVGGFRLWKQYGKVIAPAAPTRESAVPVKADLPNTTPSSQGAPTGSFTPPGKEPGCTDKPEVRMLVWAWNAQMGAMLANGGPQATTGSLMCRHGVNLKFIRQDDSSKMQEELVAFATELSQGKANPTRGAHYVCIMGDGSATFLKGVNDTLRRLGPEYTAKIVGSCGYSRGEDKFMGPPDWKANPAASRGGVVAGVLRDGDWNIAQKWLGDNSLPNNPDEKTYDPEALNWVAASDYIDAAEKYIAGYSEERPVVSHGKRTGQTKKVTVKGVVTWTPGDVSVAQKKGGLVSIVSTKEYSSQMPNVIIGIDKWMKANRPTVEGMLQAIMEGGDQVKANPAALSYAAGVSAAVYKEAGADAAYWEKYYKGTQEKDKQGLPVDLGGSSVNNLADNLLLFGLVPGSADLFGATYRVFGDIVVAQYPQLVPSYQPEEQITDLSYLKAIAQRAGPNKIEVAKAKPVYPTSGKGNKAGKKSVVVSRRSWKIRFQSGKAEFTPDAKRDLERLKRDLLVAGGTTIEIHGHTDNQGSPATNMALSEARAFAVKKWLQKQSSVNFPSERVRVFAHGQQNPVAENSTPEGRAENRRVDIVLSSPA